MGGQPQRVCIVGCGGTGKSTLARRLGAMLDLPVLHMDALFWKPGWEMTAGLEVFETIERLAATDRWIFDGNWGATMSLRFPRADTIIWLDFPTHEALWGAIRRVAHGRGRVRPDMGEGCPERWDWGFIKWILNFRRTSRERIVANIERHARNADLIQLTRRRQVRGLLERMATSPPDSANFD